MTKISYCGALYFLSLGLLLSSCRPLGTSSSSRGRNVPASASLGGGGASRGGSSSSSSHGGGGGGTASGKLSVNMPPSSHDGGSYESVPLSDNIKPLLNIAGFESHIGDLAANSKGDCALGVREGLEKLFGNPIGGQGHAYQYNDTTLNRFAAKKGLKYKTLNRASTPPFQDFDVQVLQPKSGGSEYGHIEVFYKGRWYSDFKQTMSLADSSRHNYSSIQVYRLSGGLGIAMFIRRELNSLANWLLPSAVASPAKGEAKKSIRRKTLAESTDKTNKRWKIIESWNGELPTYLLYRSAKTTEVVATNSEGFFLLLNAAPQAVPAHALADDFLKRRSASEGRDAVQAEILDTKGLLEIQRDAYVRAGYELPKNYNLILIDKK